MRARSIVVDAHGHRRARARVGIFIGVAQLSSAGMQTPAASPSTAPRSADGARHARPRPDGERGHDRRGRHPAQRARAGDHDRARDRAAGVEAAQPHRRRPRLDRPVPAAAVAGLGHREADRRPARTRPSKFYSALLQGQRLADDDASPRPRRRCSAAALPTRTRSGPTRPACSAGRCSATSRTRSSCYVGATPLTRGAAGRSARLHSDCCKATGARGCSWRHDTDPNTLALFVADDQAGWQYAHWLVAHAQDTRHHARAVRQPAVDGEGRHLGRGRRIRRPPHRARPWSPRSTAPA